jgi:nitrogen fixation/metabolism regulation signal transduction histidine kinase
MASEVFVIISILISWKLYQQLLQPLKLLMSGIDAIRDKDFNVKFLPTGKHEVDQLIGVYNQMMDSLRTERTRQEQQHFFLEKLIQTSPTGIIILNFDNRVKQLNPAALKIIGLQEKELINHSVSEISHDIFKRIAELKNGQTGTVKLQGADTYKIQKSHFIDRGFSLHFIMIQELTAEILTAEKNVYGKVIRMMAHEVNNTIGPVNSIIQSALKTDKLWEPLPHDKLKDAMQVALDRNQNLNLFMRNFADLVKLPLPNKSRVDLHTCIRNIIDLFELPAREKNIALKFEASADPFYILADQQLMEQALINIVKNAIEAISVKGEIMFKSDIKNLRLTIVDNGKGLSEKDSDQLFTPFYSSKKDGQGIGLTLVKEILANHGFSFSLKTVAMGQTEFSIFFN